MFQIIFQYIRLIEIYMLTQEFNILFFILLIRQLLHLATEELVSYLNNYKLKVLWALFQFKQFKALTLAL